MGKLGSLLYIFVLVGISLSSYADDNQITISQTGDNFELDITQIGYNNIIKQWTASEGIEGEDNTVIIKQANDRGASEDQNILEIRRVWGDRNTLKLGQGYQVGTNGNFTIDNLRIRRYFCSSKHYR